ncbi:MAG: hypothetical protein WCG23_11655 [bacterium]
MNEQPKNYLDDIFSAEDIDYELMNSPKEEDPYNPSEPHFVFYVIVIKTFLMYLDKFVDKAQDSFKNIYLTAQKGLINIYLYNSNFSCELRIPTITTDNSKILREAILTNFKNLLAILKSIKDDDKIAFKKVGNEIFINIPYFKNFPLDDIFKNNLSFIDKQEEFFNTKEKFKNNLIDLNIEDFNKFLKQSSKLSGLIKPPVNESAFIMLEENKAYYEAALGIIELEDTDVKEKMVLSKGSVDLIKNFIQATNQIKKHYKKTEGIKNNSDLSIFSLKYCKIDKKKIFIDSQYFSLILPLEYLDNENFNLIKSKFNQNNTDTTLVYDIELEKIKIILKMVKESTHLNIVKLFVEDKVLYIESLTEQGKKFKEKIGKTNKESSFTISYELNTLIKLFSVFKKLDNGAVSINEKNELLINCSDEKLKFILKNR